MSADFRRRDLLKLLSIAGLAAPLALPAPDPGAPLYFTKDEFALLDALTEFLIPADAHSPGAHAAGVAAYIDKSVAEAFLAKEKEEWRQGLAAVNKLAEARQSSTFLQAPKNQQVAIIEEMAAFDAPGKSGKHASRRQEGDPAQKFFGQLKYTTVFVYYSSSIGIHQEMNYKGNVLLDEFVGYMPDAQLPPISAIPAAT